LLCLGCRAAVLLLARDVADALESVRSLPITGNSFIEPLLGYISVALDTRTIHSRRMITWRCGGRNLLVAISF